MSDGPDPLARGKPRILYVPRGEVGRTIEAAVDRVEGVAIEATDGADAIKRLDYEPVDVVVVPAALPDVPLDAFLRWVDGEGSAGPPVVVGEAEGAAEPMIQLPADVSVEALAERIDRAVLDRRLGEEVDRHERLKTAFLRIAGAVVDAGGPERIEAVVYDELVGSDAYRSAWLGRTDADDEQVALTRPIRRGGSTGEVVALLGGSDASFLDRAIESGEVTTGGPTAGDGDPSDDDVVLTAVPFHDGDRTHGFAVIATGTRDAPDATERSLLGRIGRTCGVALAVEAGLDDGTTERMEGLFRVVAHELRNPLQIAALSLETAREEGDEAAFERLSEALGTMESVIDATVDMAIDRGVDELAETDVHEVAVTTWRDVRKPPAELTIVEPVSVEADPAKLERLLSNLLRNAIDHAGPDVSVRVGTLAGGRGFYVEDDGPGIPYEERDSVFEWGYSTNREGLGVGLPFVREIASAHGWEVAVTARNGGGARFEVLTSPEQSAQRDGLTRLFSGESSGFEFRDATAE